MSSKTKNITPDQFNDSSKHKIKTLKERLSNDVPWLSTEQFKDA